MCGSGFARHTEAIAAAGNFDIEAAFDLSQVFVKLTTKIGQSAVIGGLQDEVLRNLDSIQSRIRLPRSPVIGKPDYRDFRLTLYDEACLIRDDMSDRPDRKQL